MGSGMFPLSLTLDELGERLNKIANDLDKICDEVRDDIYSGDSGGMQYDNAASDGGSLALLRLAVKLIRDELKI